MDPLFMAASVAGLVSLKLKPLGLLVLPAKPSGIRAKEVALKMASIHEIFTPSR